MKRETQGLKPSRFPFSPYNTSNAILGGQTAPLQANNEEHPVGLEESGSMQIQEGEHYSWN